MSEDRRYIGDRGGGVLAIDFGTSSTVAVLRSPDGRSRPLLFDGSPLLPSAVYADPGGALLTGRDALHMSRFDPGRCEPYPKRRIMEGSVLLGDREVPVTDLLAAVFRRVADEAARVAGGLPDTVLTCPAGWGGLRRVTLRRAATLAGLAVVAVIAEPTAAAMYYTTVLGGEVPDGGAIGVVDLGAGTLDVAVVQMSAGRAEVVAAGGADDLGGLDMDAALADHLEAWSRRFAPQVWNRLAAAVTADDLRDRTQLWADIRSAKEMLSRAAQAGVRIPGHPSAVHVTRSEFESRIAELVRRISAVTAEVVGPADRLAGLFLVGGATRVPLVASHLHRALGCAPAVIEQPELAVAEGALATVPPTVADVPTLPEPVAVPAPAATRIEPEPRPPWFRRVTAAVVPAIVALALLTADRAMTDPPVHPPAVQAYEPAPSAPQSSPAGSAPAPVRWGSAPGPLAGTAELRTFVAGWDTIDWGPLGCAANHAGRAPNGSTGVAQLFNLQFWQTVDSVGCVKDDLQVLTALFPTRAIRDAVWNRYVDPTDPYRADTRTTATIDWATEPDDDRDRGLMWRDPATATLGIVVARRSAANLRQLWTDHQPK